MNRLSTFLSVLFLASVVLAIPGIARAQGSRHDGMVFGVQGRPVPGATIAVCTQPAVTTTSPCSPLATLYTDSTMTTTAPNPSTSDGLGNYHFYAAPGTYTIQYYGPGINLYTIPDVVLPINPSNPDFSNLTANGISAFTLTLGGNLSVAGNASVAGTLTTGAFNPASISTTTLSVSGSNTLAAAGNAQLKPRAPSDVVNSTTGENIVYVSPNGSDSNDCLSWGSPCLTLYHAYELLPLRKLLVGVAGGQIFFSQGSAIGGPVANQGLWVMGVADPNYCSIAATSGLVRASNVVTVTCSAAVPYSVGASIAVHNADNPDFDGVFIVASVSGSTFTYSQTAANETSQNGAVTPAGWLPSKSVRISGVASQAMTGTNWANEPAAQFTAGSQSSAALPGIWLNGVAGFSIDHMSLYSCAPVVMGEDSNGKLSDGYLSGVQISNSTFSANATSGCGPTETIGSNVLWLWQNHDTFTGNSTAALSSDQRANILLNGGAGAASSSQELYFTNLNFNGGGGFKVHGASMPGSWQLKASNILEESDGSTLAQPVLWIADANCAATVYADNLAVSDAPSGSMPAFENDSTCPAAQFVLGDNILQGQPAVPSIEGPAVVLAPQNINAVSADPITQHEYGIWGLAANSPQALPHISAQVDDARRGFSPTAARFPTIFDQTFASWTLQSGATKTTGVAAPDGTSNAVKISTASGSGDIMINEPTGNIYNVGDWVIGGIWAKPDAVGQSFGNPAPGGCIGVVEWTNGVLTTPQESWPPGAAGIDLCPSTQGDGHWEWIPFAAKITSGASVASSEMFLYADATHPIDYFAPMLLHIPAGAVSDSEALEIMQTLRPYSDSCPVGTICGLRGQTLDLPGSLAVAGGQPWFDVAAFGAKCDDSTDDTAAITAALAAVPSTGGIVRFPGACKTTSTITINKPNVTFLGLNHFQFITQNPPASYIDFQGTAGNAITVAAQGFEMKDLGVKYPTTVGGPLAPPAAPALSQVSGSGCPAETYYVETTYINPQGQTTASSESSYATTAGNCLQVASPASSGTATGWNVWVAANTNNETLQNSSPIAFGTPWTFAGTLINLGYRPLANTTAYAAISDDNGGQYDGVKLFTNDSASVGTASVADGYQNFGCCARLHNVHISGFGVGVTGAGSNNDFFIEDSYIQSNNIGAYMSGGADIAIVATDFEANGAGNVKIVYGAPYTIDHDYFEQPYSPTGYIIQLGDTTLPPQGALSVLPQNVTIANSFFQCGLTSYPPAPIELQGVESVSIDNNQFSQCGAQNIIHNIAGASADIRIHGNIADTAPLSWITSTTGVVESDLNGVSKFPGTPFFYGLGLDSASGASNLTWRSGGSTEWTTSATPTALSFSYNGHLGETTFKLAPFGGQSYAGVYDNFGMTAGFVSVTESGGGATFDAGLGNSFELTLNANVTSSTLQNTVAGQWLNFIICQPATGGPFTFAWPSSVRGSMTIGTTAGKCSAQSFLFDGSSAFATSPGASNQ